LIDFAAIREQGPRFGQAADRDRPDAPERPARTRVAARRCAMLKAAGDVLRFLPDEGEALDAVMTGVYDLMHLLVALLDKLGTPCVVLRVATLSLAGRNVAELRRLLDEGEVGRLDVLVSDFFRKHDKELFAALLAQIADAPDGRGRVAAARSHCKVVTVALDDGRRYTLTGSANLRTNKNLEQVTLTRSAGLFAFYDAWLDGTVGKFRVYPTDDDAAG
jgi:hypothetical protein